MASPLNSSDISTAPDSPHPIKPLLVIRCKFTDAKGNANADENDHEEKGGNAEPNVLHFQIFWNDISFEKGYRVWYHFPIFFDRSSFSLFFFYLENFDF